MPISNGTEERVGVEVSGPTHSSTHTGKALVRAGRFIAIVGLLIRKPIVTLTGLLKMGVGSIMFWRAKRREEKHVEVVSPRTKANESLPILTVLDPKEELPAPDQFNNLIVTFYKPCEEEIRGEKIVEIDFNDVNYTVTYYGTDLTPETKLLEMAEEPIHVALHQLKPTQYQVNVTSA